MKHKFVSISKKNHKSFERYNSFHLHYTRPFLPKSHINSTFNAEFIDILFFLRVKFNQLAFYFEDVYELMRLKNWMNIFEVCIYAISWNKSLAM